MSKKMVSSNHYNHKQIPSLALLSNHASSSLWSYSDCQFHYQMNGIAMHCYCNMKQEVLHALQIYSHWKYVYRIITQGKFYGMNQRVPKFLMVIIAVSYLWSYPLYVPGPINQCYSPSNFDRFWKFDGL